MNNKGSIEFALVYAAIVFFGVFAAVKEGTKPAPKPAEVTKVVTIKQTVYDCEKVVKPVQPPKPKKKCE